MSIEDLVEAFDAVRKVLDQKQSEHDELAERFDRLADAYRLLESKTIGADDEDRLLKSLENAWMLESFAAASTPAWVGRLIKTLRKRKEARRKAVSVGVGEVTDLRYCVAKSCLGRPAPGARLCGAHLQRAVYLITVDEDRTEGGEVPPAVNPSGSWP